MNSNSRNSNNENPDVMARQMAEKLALQRNVLRQRDIVNDSDKLLELARELQAEVAKSNKDELSVDVVKKAEEIEKLAKKVKEKMRDGQ